jgi:hypothetical protein
MHSNPDGATRIQLQQQSGGRTIHQASYVLRAQGGISTQELCAALHELRTDLAISGRLKGRADAALARAVEWVLARLPAGVSGRFSKSFYFDPHEPQESWRFDIEGLNGYNLLR